MKSKWKRVIERRINEEKKLISYGLRELIKRIERNGEEIGKRKKRFLKNGGEKEEIVEIGWIIVELVKVERSIIEKKIDELKKILRKGRSKREKSKEVLG